MAVQQAKFGLLVSALATLTVRCLTVLLELDSPSPDRPAVTAVNTMLYRHRLPTSLAVSLRASRHPYPWKLAGVSDCSRAAVMSHPFSLGDTDATYTTCLRRTGSGLRKVPTTHKVHQGRAGATSRPFDTMVVVLA